MLTTEALEARFWGGRNRLRSLLSGAKISDDVYGMSSVSANIFTEIDDLLNLSLVIVTNRNQVLQRIGDLPRADQTGGPFLDDLHREIAGVREHLGDFSERLQCLANDLGNLFEEIRIAANPLDPASLE
ncbi:MAG: hypothetical protein ABI906_02715 [Pseudomonadota bacterium]